MEYRTIKRNGDEISLLGFGLMRLPQKRGSIDMELSQQLVKKAVDNGINYFDTAYFYGNGSGSNERAFGEILENLGYRDKIKIATKMNRMAINSKQDMEDMFADELNNLKTDYIDYYFIHNLISYSDIEKLINEGLFDFISEKKREGQIINIGFSFHGSYNDFVKILDVYDWDTTLIQFNYLDENIQAGIKGLKLAAKKDMAVMIMEPLKAGLLADMIPTEAQEYINNSDVTRSNVDLAFNWIFKFSEVTCVLSGMNSMEMLEENIEIANNHKNNPLSRDELHVIKEVKKIIKRLNKIDCTSCNYCMPCPQNVNIPDIFKLYNDKYLFPENKMMGINASLANYTTNVLGFVGENRDVSLCTNCRECLGKCPQQLNIPDLLNDVDKEFHGRWIRPIVPVAKKIMGKFL